MLNFNKYLKYIFKVISLEVLMLVRVLFYFLVRDYRSYIRNVVVNYEISNNIDNPFRDVTIALDKIPTNLKPTIVKKDVNYITYIIVKYFLWIWLDDNARYDTYGINNISSLLSSKKLIKHYTKNSIVGSYNELGDIRSLNPLTCIKLELINIKNYKRFNYYYATHYINTLSEVFLITIHGREFGYKYSHTHLGKAYYRLVFNIKK